ETSASGYGGDVGVIVAIDVENNEIFGVEVTTHNETPGLGATVETDEEFKNQFKGMEFDSDFAVKDDNGDINAIAGATVTSRAVCKAVDKAVKIYRDKRSQINDKVKTFTG
ncbi:MAG: FMN-binding protein, partial [Desulfosalsimonas sp.]